ncbi:hypothetical protein [Agrococcus versicolor]
MKTIALAASGVLALTGGALMLPQADAALSPTTAAELEQLFVDHDVPQHQWQGLLDAVEAGVPVGAQTDQPPVSTESYARGAMEGTISRWADGSFATSLEEVPVEVQPGQVMARAVAGCVRYTSAGATSSTGCMVSETVFNLTTSFQANYWQSVSQARITRAWNYNASCIGCSWTFEHLRITKGTGFSNSRPSTAELVLMVTMFGSNSRTWLQLSVGPTAVSTQKNY